MCFTICFPLFLHLTNNGIENTIRVGVCEGRNHFWIRLNDETIIDPTVQQFNFGKNLSSVYIGRKTHNYIEDETVEDWLNATCETWKSPYCYSEAFYSGGVEFNLTAGFKLNTNGSILISNEIDELGIDISKTPEYESYFSGIKVILEKHPNEEEYLEFSRNKDFDRLLAKVLKY